MGYGYCTDIVRMVYSWCADGVRLEEVWGRCGSACWRVRTLAGVMDHYCAYFYTWPGKPVGDYRSPRRSALSGAWVGALATWSAVVLYVFGQASKGSRYCGTRQPPAGSQGHGRPPAKRRVKRHWRGFELRDQSCWISSQSGWRSESLRAICWIFSLPPMAMARWSQSRAASSWPIWQA